MSRKELEIRSTWANFLLRPLPSGGFETHSDFVFRLRTDAVHKRLVVEAGTFIKRAGKRGVRAKLIRNAIRPLPHISRKVKDDFYAHALKIDGVNVVKRKLIRLWLGVTGVLRRGLWYF